MSRLYIYREFKLGQPLGQLRAAPIQLSPEDGPGLLMAYAEDADIDPFMGMFFFPQSCLKLSLWHPHRGLLWTRALHGGNIPGTWFTPMMPFDLDGDGKDEIWMVQNADADHPLDIKQYVLACIDPATGETLQEHPWYGLDFDDYTMSSRYRHFLMGGYVNGKPVLVTAQGTYTKLQLQGWNPGMSLRWKQEVFKDEPGARASHTCPVFDIDGDGNDELMFGERCIRMDNGSYVFVADKETYHGHSDVISPVYLEDDGRWRLFTARESFQEEPPRVVMFDDNGQRLWTDLDSGHMDMGWSARLRAPDEVLCYAVRIGGKSAGPEGFRRQGLEEFVWDARTGSRVSLECSLFERIPVDIDGDGIQELVSTGNEYACDLINAQGQTIGSFDDGAKLAMANQFTNLAGEQLLVYYPNGTVRIYADRQAVNSPEFDRRRKCRAYQNNQRLTAVGYNLANLGGIQDRK